MQRKKTSIKKVFSVVGLSVIGLFVFGEIAMATGWDPGAMTNTGLSSATISDILTGVLNWLLRIVGIVGVIGFAIAGIMYLTSAGQEEQIKLAKKAMVNSILGVVVAISGLVIIYAADALLTGQGGI
ncbi:MAG: hypothetical protein WCK16_00325 [Candidatus Moraniibacteriota bacterium]